VREPSSYEVLGQTLDDAAGEALDKAARLLGLGFPGGPAIERLARDGDPKAFDFPVAMIRGANLDFSFSGLKTALVYRCRDLGEVETGRRRADLAAGFQAAVVGQLVAKLKRALRSDEWQSVALGGGVAANGPLRDAVSMLCEEHNLRMKLVAPALCTDNAAMIASAARFTEPMPYPEYLSLDAAAAAVAKRAPSN
jgi:N6-L-threonylcarbamoyladenine synthase